EVSSPPEKAMPTRSPTGSAVRTLDTALHGTDARPQRHRTGVCAVALAMSAVLDASNTPGVAVVQAALAIAALAGSVALWAGIGTV
ncbi:MAG: hypothetical protein ACKOFD_01255, partial [Actinomycetota bacterium]